MFIDDINTLQYIDEYTYQGIKIGVILVKRENFIIL